MFFSAGVKQLIVQKTDENLYSVIQKCLGA